MGKYVEATGPGHRPLRNQLRAKRLKKRLQEIVQRIDRMVDEQLDYDPDASLLELYELRSQAESLLKKHG